VPSNLYMPPEESLGKVYDSRIIGRVFRYARPYAGYLILAMFLAAMLAGSDIILPYLVKIGIDRFIVVQGRLVDLTVIPQNDQDRLSRIYAEKSVIIDGTQKPAGMVITEGVLDPKDRAFLISHNALDHGNYYLLDLNRYSIEARPRVQELIADKPEMFVSTVQKDLFIVETDTLADLPDRDRNLIRAPDWTGIAKISTVYLGILVLAFALTFGQVYLMAWIGQYIMYDIRTDLFRHIEHLPIPFFNKQPTGRLVTRVTNDVNVLNEMFTSILVDVFKNILKLLGIAIAMLLLAPRLALVTFTLLPVIIIVTWIFKRKMRRAYRLVRAKIAEINSVLSEHLSGIRVIQMFAKEEAHFKKFSRINRECYDANMQQLVVHSMFSPFIVFLENLGIALILYYGGGQVIRDAVSLGTLVAFLSYVSMFYGPVRDTAEKFNIMQSAMASSERILQIFDKDPEDLNDPPAIDPTDTVMGDIEFENVWFAYTDNDWVLKDVSFKVPAGQTVALVGATGSGKTTIINLISKFYDIQRGKIRIDGRDIEEYPRKVLRRKMAVVLQDVFLFAGDLRRNIRLNEENISNDDIEKVARLVLADKFITRLPGEYEHLLEEEGTTLSQGQRQLLAFARALAFDPSILILDEATANIDSETESWIQQALNELVTSRTALIVAHRLSTIKKADNIIVMHQGKIRETGNHQALLAKKGIYYKLYQLQFKHQVSTVN